ncbi:MAG: hypothetical protein AB1489_30375 [Acidobacteriota bacterium]
MEAKQKIIKVAGLWGALLVLLISSYDIPSLAAGQSANSANNEALWTAYNLAVYDASVYQHWNLRKLKPLTIDPNSTQAKVTTLTATDYKPDRPDRNLGGRMLPPECIKDRNRLECILSEDVWVTVIPEVQEICRTFQGDLALQLRQLIGLPPDYPFTHFVQMTVEVKDVFRPTPDPNTKTEWPCADPKNSQCGNVFSTGVSAAFIDWYTNNTLDSFRIPQGFPWTHLGYTYNWKPGADKYGASEYVVRKGSKVTIDSVIKAEEYCRPISPSR